MAGIDEETNSKSMKGAGRSGDEEVVHVLKKDGLGGRGAQKLYFQFLKT
jgi:hypothetical protein